jgi:hypothetical protein
MLFSLRQGTSNVSINIFGTQDNKLPSQKRLYAYCYLQPADRLSKGAISAQTKPTALKKPQTQIKFTL